MNICRPGFNSNFLLARRLSDILFFDFILCVKTALPEGKKKSVIFLPWSLIGASVHNDNFFITVSRHKCITCLLLIFKIELKDWTYISEWSEMLYLRDRVNLNNPILMMILLHMTQIDWNKNIHMKVTGEHFLPKTLITMGAWLSHTHILLLVVNSKHLPSLTFI